MKLRGLIDADETGGNCAEIPALPGCVTQGETIDKIREAIETQLEAGDAWA